MVLIKNQIVIKLIVTCLNEEGNVKIFVVPTGLQHLDF